MKMCSTAIVIRQMQIKATVKCHYTPPEWLKLKSDSAKCWQGCDTARALVHCWGLLNGVLVKLNSHLLYGSTMLGTAQRNEKKNRPQKACARQLTTERYFSEPQKNIWKTGKSTARWHCELYSAVAWDKVLVPAATVGLKLFKQVDSSAVENVKTAVALGKARQQLSAKVLDGDVLFSDRDWDTPCTHLSKFREHMGWVW